ncbi:MAG: P-loop NTPase fold protein [Pseudoruegeria sp.]
MIVSDNETAVDLLYYEAIAKTVVRIVSERSDEPLSVGVHGDWGAGKSSVLMMVEKAFEGDERVLIETIVDELVKNRSIHPKSLQI